MECVWDMEQIIKFRTTLFLRKVNGFFSFLIKDYTNQTEHRLGFFYINLNTYLREVVFCEKKMKGDYLHEPSEVYLEQLSKTRVLVMS